MSRGRIYTLLIFIVSFAVVFGGWFFTKEMLNRQKATILAQKGQISVAVAEVEVSEDIPLSGEFEGTFLTEHEIAQVLTIWNSGGRDYLHEPMTGQMNMEQAINAGREWIDKLAGYNIIPGYLSECNFDDTNAVLSSMDSSLSLEESYISYWKVSFIKEDVEIELTIHALSGQVWDSKISMNEENMIYGTCSNEQILAIAFPFLISSNSEVKVEDSTIYRISEEGTVYSTLKRDHVLVNKEQPMERLWLGLRTNIE